jgi:hypothetical protein
MHVSGLCALRCHWQTSCARLEGLRSNVARMVEVRAFTVASPKPMRGPCCWSNIMSVMAPFSLAGLSAREMAASRYRRISTMGNCVTFVIFPAAVGIAPVRRCHVAKQITQQTLVALRAHAAAATSRWPMPGRLGAFLLRSDDAER